MPGAVFHVTARTQGRVDYFDPRMRDHIREAMTTVQQHTDAKLRAFVIMSNHMHIVLQQGVAPLAMFMQPLLTRVALAVKRRTQCDGHVFGRTYWDGVCDDVVYLTSLIQYIHANPVRAGLCRRACEWPWSSHLNYADSCTTTRPVVEPFSPLGTVATNATALTTAPLPRSAIDLRDLMMLTLRQIVGDELTLHELHMLRSREAAAIRRRLIVRAGEAGYAGVTIARFLGVSEATVSKTVRGAKLPRPR